MSTKTPTRHLLSLAALAVPLASAGLPMAVYLPPYYAASLGLGVVGLAFMLTRLWDAASDPMIGLLSDRTVSRFGRRKPWIAAGSPVFVLATLALFAPGLFGARPDLTWLIVWLGVFYLGWTMVQIPFAAWTGALAAQYHERSRVQTWMQVAGALGLLSVLVMPAVLDAASGASGGGADPGQKLAWMGAFIIATFIPAVSAALILAPEPPAQPQRRTPGAVREDLLAVVGDGLLRRVLASDFAVTLGQLIRSTLFVFFVSVFMGRPDLAASLFLLQFVFGVAAGPIWLRIGYRLGKARAAVAGELVQVAINLGLLAVSRDQLPLLLALTIAQGLAQGSGNLMLRAMIADLADRQKLDSGRDRTGLLFSVFSLTGKAATAAAVGLALPLVGLLGFQPGGTNTPEALLGLKLVFALGPAAAHAVSALLIVGFPLNAQQHAEIRRQLDAEPAPASAGAH